MPCVMPRQCLFIFHEFLQRVDRSHCFHVSFTSHKSSYYDIALHIVKGNDSLEILHYWICNAGHLFKIEKYVLITAYP